MAEVHEWKGKHYLFGSCKAENRARATHIYVADSPMGEFVPVSKDPITPNEWECLDGTFFVENGKPYMGFCHEWTQVKNGEICAVELSEDLTAAKGKPFVLFRAGDNPSVSELRENSGDYVTDGPFLFKEKGKLRMIWSSFYKGRYLVLEAEADNLRGEWKHFGGRFDFDGGHAMLFETLEGKRMIALHYPNTVMQERANFLPF